MRTSCREKHTVICSKYTIVLELCFSKAPKTGFFFVTSIVYGVTYVIHTLSRSNYF